MSYGISGRQRTIVRVLREQGPLTTPDLLKVLQDRGTIRSDMPAEQVMHTLRRACKSLQRRDMVKCEGVRDDELPGRITHRWWATEGSQAPV